MELDELKQQLNKRMEGNLQPHSADELSVMLKKQAASVVLKIRRNLWIELSLSVIFTIGCVIAITIISAWAYLTILIGSAILGLIVSAILGFLIWKIGKLNSSTLSVKKNLETIISIIYRYVWLYFRFGIGSIPLCFGLAFWLSYYPVDGVFKPINTEILLYMIVGLLIFSYLSFRFTKWYLRKLYGNYAEQLEILLQEIETN